MDHTDQLPQKKRRIKLIVAYDGTAYCGFQLQPNGNTIQAELEKAISNTEGYTSVSDVSNDDIQSYRELLDKRKVMEYLKSKTTVINPAESDEGYTGYTAAPADAEPNQ